MKETVYSLEVFKLRMEDNHAHYKCTAKPLDQYNIMYRVGIHVTSPSRLKHNGKSDIVEFLFQQDIDAFNSDKYAEVPYYDRCSKIIKDKWDELIDKYALPVGATEGEWSE